ncbi:MAG: hypothetical protein HYS55_01470 [Candidatus Omnitrophica bacterium]|nr:hypothetical protein [Candidatus Omnitrophota bacterium]
MIRIVALTVAILLLGGSPKALSTNDSSSKKPIEILSNRLESVQKRLEAARQIKLDENPKIMPDLIRMVRDPDDSIVIRSQVIELLIASSDPWIWSELKNMLGVSSLSQETKRLAVYALYKKNSKEAMPLLVRSAQNPRESAELRTTALSYLSQIDGNYPSFFWRNLLKSKEHPVPVRIAAMNGMETLGILKAEGALFSQMLQDPNEPVELRKSIILTAGRVFTPNEFQTEIIGIIANSKNASEIRRFAIDNLANFADRSLVPQLEGIAAKEKDPAVLQELSTLIKKFS